MDTMTGSGSMLSDALLDSRLAAAPHHSHPGPLSKPAWKPQRVAKEISEIWQIQRANEKHAYAIERLFLMVEIFFLPDFTQKV
jgi:hypothetical protein